MRSRKSLSHRWPQLIVGFMVVLGSVMFPKDLKTWAASPTSASFKLQSSSTNSSGVGSSTSFSLTGTTGEPSSGATMSSTSFKTLPGYRLGDQSPGVLQFSSGTFTVAENGGTATITVTRAGGSSGAVSVDYASSDGTATAGGDYTSVSGTLSWTTGEATSKTISIPISSDDTAESDETVNLTLSNVTLASLGTQSTAVLTISNDANEAPLFTNLNATPSFTEGGTAVSLDSDVTLSDTELDAANSANGNYNGATLTLARNGGTQSNDVFSNTGSLAALTESGNLTYNSTTLGTVTTNSSGTLLLTFNSSATSSLVDSVLQNINYSNSSDAPSTSVKIDYVFNDGGNTGQGSGGAQSVTGSVTISINQVNDAPVNTVAPSIAGDIQVNGTVTANKGSWNDNKDGGTSTISYAYQWHISDNADGSNPTNISGATSSSYIPILANLFKFLSVTVTATDDGVGSGGNQSVSLTTGFTSAIQPDPVALALIAGFASNNNAVALTFSDLNNVGVTNGTTDNLAAYQCAIEGATGGTADSFSEIRALVDAGDAAVALVKVYADANNAAAMTIAQLKAASCSSLVDGNLATYQKLIAASTGTDADTSIEHKALVVTAHNLILPISIYASNNDASTLSIAELQNIGIINRVGDNLPGYQSLIGSATSTDVDTTAEIQTVVRNVNTAVEVIAAYATGNDASALVDSQLTAAGVTGTVEANLVAYQKSVAGAQTTASDSTTDIQSLITSVNAAVAVIEAHDSSSTSEITTAQLETLAISGVIAANQGFYNSAFALAAAEGANDVAKIQTIVNSVNAAGFNISAISGATTEAGTTATFTVSLLSAPTADVTIALSSSDTTEGTVNLTQLVFTTSNFGQPQTVTVSGVDDLEVDGDQGYTIVLGTVVSADISYSGRDPQDVSVSNGDDDIAGFSISEVQGILKEDPNTPNTATFTVRLKAQPQASVSLDLRISDTTEGSFSATAIESIQSLTFTAENWQVDRTITIFSVDDEANDGDVAFETLFENLVSNDPAYTIQNPQIDLGLLTRNLLTQDNDAAAFLLSVVSGNTSEDGKSQASMQVSLRTQPTGTVTVNVSSDNESEVTVAPSTLEFTPSNWAALQTVEFSGVDDAAVDGSQVVVIRFEGSNTSATEYQGVTASSQVTNEDNDQAGLVISAISGNTKEDGTSATFTIRLKTPPSTGKTVTLGLSSTRATEGVVGQEQLVFSEENWNSDQSVLVFGKDDALRDGKQSYKIQINPSNSSDLAYQALAVAEVDLINEDDEVVGIVLSDMSNDVTESGTTGNFTVRLQLAPTSNVTVSLTSSNINEGLVSPSSMTFTPENWRSEQSVTVTGVRGDGQIDGDQTFIVKLAVASADEDYNSLIPDNVQVVNVDIDQAGLVVGRPTASVSEDGDIASFSLGLLSAPTGNVVVDLSSSNVNEGTVSPAQLTFTADNWNAQHLVTVQGQDDNPAVVDGPQQFFVQMAINAGQTTDSNYHGVHIEDVEFFNADNDAAGFVVSPISGAVQEDGLIPQFFTVQLRTQPSNGATVSVNVSSSDSSEGRVSPQSLVFTQNDWGAAHRVNVFGVDDTNADGDQSFYIHFDQAISDDANYKATPPSVTVVNEDNDVARFIVSSVSNNVREDGTQATFTVRLGSAITGNVTLPISIAPSDEAQLSQSTLTFTAQNWSADQVVTITGLDDQTPDGDQKLSIALAAASSTTDTSYNGLDPEDLESANEDDDVAGVLIVQEGQTVNEDQSRTRFQVRLRSQPTTTVTVDLSVTDATEAQLPVTRLTFNRNNWDAWKSVNVVGVNDDLEDGDQPFSVQLAVSSSDPQYSSLPVERTSFVNEDNDVSGFQITAFNERLREDGTRAHFVAKLRTLPSEGEVTLTYTISDTSEAQLLNGNATGTLTFTSDNWNANQKVTLKGADDDIADGDQNFLITFVATQSNGGKYNGLIVAPLKGTTTDNDAAAFIFEPLSSAVREDGTQATFGMRLRSKPDADVTVNFESSDTTEATLSTQQLLFTNNNWMSLQQVTVTGVDDTELDGDQSFQINFTGVSSTDTNYAALTLTPLSGNNQDDDAGGFLLSAMDQNVNEQGQQGFFTVRLRSQPANDATVTVVMSSSDSSEGAIVDGDETIVFTKDNWSAEQKVRVVGINDFVNDEDQQFVIQFDSVTSADNNYNGTQLNIDPVAVVNEDDDVAGFVFTPITRDVQEDGTTATFEISLRSQPANGESVTITTSSSNANEGTVLPASITFTANDWRAQHSVRVQGVDDNIIDGDQSFQVEFSQAVSNDPKYSGQIPEVVPLHNLDDDVPEFIFSSVSGQTSEKGDRATLSIRLRSAPAQDVTLPLEVSDTSEATVFPSSLTFTAIDWKSPQLVTLVGVDDALVDGNQSYRLKVKPSVSNDANYDQLDPADIVLSNVDDDSAGFLISEMSGNVNEEGLEQFFTVRLTTEPTAEVTIPLSLSTEPVLEGGNVVIKTTTEGIVKISTLTFSASNWNADQRVGVIGEDDSVQDGNQPFSILLGTVSSNDANYNGLVAGEVSVTNEDNDDAGIVVGAALNNLENLEVGEGGGSAEFFVRLRSQPEANTTVTIPLSSTKPQEVSVFPTSLVFDENNWRGRQIVTVTGQNDNVADGDQLATIRLAPAQTTNDTDSYHGVIGREVDVLNIDNDKAGILIGAIDGSTKEDGAVASFQMRLQSAPTADVNITLSSSNTSEGTLVTQNFSFSSKDWNAEKTVHIQGQDDLLLDGDRSFLIRVDSIVSNDTSYSSIDVNTVTPVEVLNIDDEKAGFIASSPQNPTSEDGAQTTICVRLSSPPTAGNAVSVGLNSSNSAEGIAYPSTLSFSALDWNTCHEVTIIGQDDGTQAPPFTFLDKIVSRFFRAESSAVKDGDQAYQVIFGTAQSNDPNYGGLVPDRVRLLNEDNDTAGFIVGDVEGTINENGSQGTFNFELRTVPTGNVTVSLISSNTEEGLVSPSQLIFTPNNWNAARQVTVTGIDDLAVDGDRNFEIQLAIANTEGSNNEYASIDPKAVSVTNEDNDSANLVISTVNGQPREDGASGSFTVSLRSAPTASVQVAVSSSATDEIAVSPSTLTFDTQNWDQAQTVTLTGVDDNLTDGNQTARISFSTAASADNNYAALQVPFLEVFNEDNDIADFLLSNLSTTVMSEADQNAGTFSLSLKTEPTAEVTIPLSVNKDDVTLSSNALVFTTANWNQTQNVTITGQDDAIADGDQVVRVLVGPTSTTDASYNNRVAAILSVTNPDNDSPGMTVSVVSGKAQENGLGSATFTIQLNTEPTADVTLTLQSSNSNEGVLASSEFTFTASGNNAWNIPQTVTVNGKDDALQDGNQTFQISATVVSADGNYNGFSFVPVTVTSLDDDQASVVASKTTLNVSENETTDSFTLKLGTQPTADVVLTLSIDATEASISPTTVTFTNSNWNQEQTLTVTGVNDEIEDGAVTVPLGIAVTSADVSYDNVVPTTISIVNADNDTAGLLVSLQSTTIAENTITTGGNNYTKSEMFTVSLSTKPTADVMLSLHSADTSEVTVSPSLLTFTDSSWATTQTVTLTAVDDVLDENAQTEVLIQGTVSSTDSVYNASTFANIVVTVVDDDVEVVEAPQQGTVGIDDEYQSALVTLGLSTDDLVGSEIEGDANASDKTYVHTPVNTSGSSLSKTTTILHKSESGGNKVGLEGIVEVQNVGNTSTIYLEGSAQGHVSDSAAFVGKKKTVNGNVISGIDSAGGIAIAITPTDNSSVVLLPETPMGADATISETSVVIVAELADNQEGAPRVISVENAERWYYMGRYSNLVNTADPDNGKVVYIRGKSGGQISITRQFAETTTEVEVTAGTVGVRVGTSDAVTKGVGYKVTVSNTVYGQELQTGRNFVSIGSNSTLSAAELELKLLTSMALDTMEQERLSLKTPLIHSFWRWNSLASGWQSFSPDAATYGKLRNDLGVSPFSTDIQISEGIWIYAESGTKLYMHDKEPGKLVVDDSVSGWHLVGNDTAVPIRVDTVLSSFSNIQSVWLPEGNSWKVYASDSSLLELIKTDGTVTLMDANTMIGVGNAFWVEVNASASRLQGQQRQLNVPPALGN